jgi:hypothetical protein
MTRRIVNKKYFDAKIEIKIAKKLPEIPERKTGFHQRKETMRKERCGGRRPPVKNPELLRPGAKSSSRHRGKLLRERTGVEEIGREFRR